VEGKLRYRSYDDRDGNKRYVVEVEADVIQLLGRKPDGPGQQGQGYQGGSQGYQNGNQGYTAPSQPSSPMQGEGPGEDLTTHDTADDLPF